MRLLNLTTLSGSSASPRTPNSGDRLPPPPTQSLQSGFQPSSSLFSPEEPIFTGVASNILQQDIDAGFYPTAVDASPSDHGFQGRNDADDVPLTELSPLDILRFGSPVRRSPAAFRPRETQQRRPFISQGSTRQTTAVTVFGYVIFLESVHSMFLHVIISFWNN